MSEQHVGHGEIAKFAQDRVNLPKEAADEYRAQARRLREKLESYLQEHPDFSLKKMLLAGSLAKGTALRTLNDIDVACYVSGVENPGDVPRLLNYLAERLRKAFPNFSPDQVKPKTYSVTVSFKGSGLDVDVVPILYNGNADWYGNLVSQDDGTLLETCIPRHLEFIRKRKQANDVDFAQVVRLVKFWAAKMKRENPEFRFKSFMIELVVARLADQGLDFSDYPEALQHFFTYVGRTGLSEIVYFTDYYNASALPACSDIARIFDPVNAKNNVSKTYTKAHLLAITDAALDAGDAIDSARHAITKQETVRYWQRVLGTSFQG